MMDFSHAIPRLFARYEGMLFLVQPKTGQIVFQNEAVKALGIQGVDGLESLYGILEQESHEQLRETLITQVSTECCGYRSLALRLEKGPRKNQTVIISSFFVEPELVAIVEQLGFEQLKDSMSEVVSAVSHEIRNPLSALYASLSLLMSASIGVTEAERQKLLQISFNNAQKLLELVKDLYRLRSLESFGLGASREKTELVQYCRAQLLELSPWAEQKPVHLKLEAEGQNYFVTIDRKRMGQALVNLLSNAIKHAPENSTILLSLKQLDGFVRVSVCDSGPGVPESIRQSIFQKFVTSDAVGKTESEGIGLGLSIAMSILKSHDSAIHYSRSEPGLTEFYFDLELDRDIKVGRSIEVSEEA